MHQVVVLDWENWYRNISDVNICFQRGSNLAESRNRMTLSRMLNIQGACLLAECAEMWNIFTVFGMKVELRLWTFSIMCVEL